MYVLMAKCYFPMKSAILIMPLFSTVVLESNSPLTRGQAASVGSIKGECFLQLQEVFSYRVIINRNWTKQAAENVTAAQCTKYSEPISTLLQVCNLNHRRNCYFSLPHNDQNLAAIKISRLNFRSKKIQKCNKIENSSNLQKKTLKLLFWIESDPFAHFFLLGSFLCFNNFRSN